MARSLSEIADDLEAAEKVIKSAQAGVMQATAAIAGASLAGVPDPNNIPLVINLPNGRQIELGALAQELRNAESSAGDFRER